MAHEVEVVIDAQLEERHDLIDHLAVLTGQHDEHLEVGEALGLPEHRGQLDRLRPGADDERRAAGARPPGHVARSTRWPLVRWRAPRAGHDRRGGGRPGPRTGRW